MRSSSNARIVKTKVLQSSCKQARYDLPKISQFISYEYRKQGKICWDNLLRFWQLLRVP